MKIKPWRSWFECPHCNTGIVFDSSTKFSDLSLNVIALQGLKLQKDMFAVLWRFRRKPVALICGVQEMYLKIKLRPEDQHYHRLLWRDVQSDREPGVYEFDRVVFGVNSSPFQAQSVAQEYVRQRKSELSLAVQTVLERTYIDDSMEPVPDVKTRVELNIQLSRLSESAGIHDRKWLSNVPEVLQSMSASVDLFSR